MLQTLDARIDQAQSGQNSFRRGTESRNYKNRKNSHNTSRINGRSDYPHYNSRKFGTRQRDEDTLALR